MPRQTEAICGECQRAYNIFNRLSAMGKGNGALGKAATEAIFNAAFKHYVFKKESDMSQPCDYIISEMREYMGGKTTDQMLKNADSIEKNSYCENGKCWMIDKIIKEDQVELENNRSKWFERVYGGGE